MLSDYLATKYDTSEMTVVSPDAGRVRLADMWTDRLNSSLAIIHKRRDPNLPNTVAIHEVVGEVEGRVCLLVDDMIDTAGTICQAAEALKARGARAVIAAATHPVLSGPAVDRLKAADFEEVIVTDTLPIPDERRFRLAHRVVDRAADCTGDPRGLRRRLSDQPLQRPGIVFGPVCSRIARFGSADFVVARRRKAPLLPPPQHGGRAISDARRLTTTSGFVANWQALPGAVG